MTSTDLCAVTKTCLKRRLGSVGCTRHYSLTLNHWYVDASYVCYKTSWCKQSCVRPSRNPLHAELCRRHGDIFIYHSTYWNGRDNWNPIQTYTANAISFDGLATPGTITVLTWFFYILVSVLQGQIIRQRLINCHYVIRCCFVVLNYMILLLPSISLPYSNL